MRALQRCFGMAVHRGLVLFGVLAACSGGEGESGPDAAMASACPQGAIEDGAACAIEPALRCMIHQDDCGLAEVCACTDGLFACAPTDFGAACAEIEDAYCAIEGVHGCFMHPTSGTRTCEGAQWVTAYSCPDGCPGPDDTPPLDGDPCSVAAGEACVYADQSCECVDGEFSCG